jgi:NTE family protein
MTGSALVLGGGGVTGVAWELGILYGLSEAGVDLTDADLVVGNSAGSVVAAQITSGTPIEQLYDVQLQGYGAERTARMSLATMLRLAVASLGARTERAALARAGRVAVAAHTISEEERRAVIAARLPGAAWPERRLLITAAAADTGEFVAFDRDSGVPLVDAVAASCAVPGVWPPATINGRHYIDGGMRSPANADLAADAERVVVIAPIGAAFRRTNSVAAQAAAMRGRVAVVSPDAAAKAAMGRNVLDPAYRAAAAQAGRLQAASIVERVASVWRDTTSD